MTNGSDSAYLSTDDWLESMPDPVPGLVSGCLWAKVRLVLAIVLAVGASAYLAEQLPWPRCRLYIVGIFAFAGVIGVNSYANTLNRQTQVGAIPDLLTGVFFSTLKYVVIANAVWSSIDHFRGSSFKTVCWQFLERFRDLGEIVETSPDVSLHWAGINLFHVALVLPWVGPVRETHRAAKVAWRFERDLRPGTERRLASLISRARLAIEKKRPKEAAPFLDKAEKILRRILPATRDRGVAYHRRLLVEKVRQLRGLSPTTDFIDDPFGETKGDRRPAPRRPATRTRAVKAEVGMAPTRRSRLPRHKKRKQKEGGDLGYEQYRSFLESLKETSSVEWSDVAGLDAVVTDLKSTFAMGLAAAPTGVSIEAPRRILLYGPPGTGKTLLTAAVCGNFDVPFYNVRVSDMLSRYFGESTRLVSSLFRMAADVAPCVIFFDEIEALCSSRDRGGMDGEERRIVAAFLAELDGLRSKRSSAPVFTIAATNVPWQLDSAILSRFDKRLYVSLPEAEARRQILDVHLAKRGFEARVASSDLVKYTRGYSGRELSQLCQEAIRQMMEEANPQLSQVVDRGPEALGDYKLTVTPLTAEHLNAAFRTIRPKTDPAALERYRRWGEEA